MTRAAAFLFTRRSKTGRYRPECHRSRSRRRLVAAAVKFTDVESAAIRCIRAATTVALASAPVEGREEIPHVATRIDSKLRRVRRPLLALVAAQDEIATSLLGR